MLINKKKRTCHFVDFAVLAKQSENKGKWKDIQILRLCQRTKKLWNMRLMVIPVIAGALGTVPKGLEKYLWNWKSVRIKTIQTTALLKFAVTPVKDHLLIVVWKSCKIIETGIFSGIQLFYYHKRQEQKNELDKNGGKEKKEKWNMFPHNQKWKNSARILTIVYLLIVISYFELKQTKRFFPK